MRCDCKCCAEAAARLRAPDYIDHHDACRCEDLLALEWCPCDFCNAQLRIKGLVG